jgi:hypothetical protein
MPAELYRLRLDDFGDIMWALADGWTSSREDAATFTREQLIERWKGVGWDWKRCSSDPPLVPVGSEPRILKLGGANAQGSMRRINLRDLGYVGGVSDEARREIEQNERRAAKVIQTAHLHWFGK